ncbi:SDR family NAD(P)-dependent oxidoreductase [Streptomyces sp. NPDC055287]
MEQNSTSAPAQPAKQTPLTRALATIRTLQRRLGEQEGNQPIAVVGVGLRLPGGIDDLDSYWTALAEGRDLVRPLPAARREPFAAEWQGLPQRGGFLDEVLDFDADFFGISPREARHLDPQHRLLLEVTWEALENAALPADRLAGTSTGLYLGIMWQDYRDWLAGEPDAYWTTGNGHNFAAGRIAYALGLNGPALSVDTACSSSLVAVHLAVQALRRGECETAFAAGVNLIMSPRSMRLVQETRSLSPDGLCRTFDARAAGFTRGEGCGAVVLKRLDHALRDGDRVHAVIRGSALNQDGRSGGFTAPNVLSQVSLIETALSAAGIEPADIGYVEAHGTGTPLGDPIEMEALATALGRRNGGAPLPVGAVKTNFGHLESAAGIAGLAKAVLCLRHRQVPPVVHFNTLNPRIDLSGTGMTVPSTLTDWSTDSGDLAAVSSFGMSGTNAQVVLGLPTADEVSALAPAPTSQGTAVTGFEISARNPQALRELAGRYAERLAGLPAGDYAAFAHTAGAGRARMETRARITADGPAAAAQQLRSLAEGMDDPAVTAAGTAGAEHPGDELPRRVVDLPSYPWQRRRHAPAPLSPASLPAPAASSAATGHPVAHHIVWEPASFAPTEPPGPDGDLVLAGDDTALLRQLVDQAVERSIGGTLLVPATGAPAETATAPAAPAVPGAPGWRTGALPGSGPDWRAFWEGRPPGEAATLVLAMSAGPQPPGESPGADPGAAGAAVCAAVTTAVAAAPAGGPPHKVLALTRAARRTAPGDQVTYTGHGALHGLAPVLGLELPTSWGGVIDLPDRPQARDLGALLDRVATGAGPGAAPPASADLAAVRDGRTLVARLRPVSEEAAAKPLPVRADATYIVTGGLGAVGRELVTDLVRRGARHLLLIGRRPEEALGEDAAELLARLRRDTARTEYRGGGCDTDAALARACAVLELMPPVRGVVHAAGTVERAPAAHTGPAEFAAALRNKAAGAWWLHRASADWELDFFTLVSSVSAVWGTEECAAYAAANGALDALAAHRVSLGLPAVSIAYGPWALEGRGMADSASLALYARLGVGALDAAQGCGALTAAAPGDGGHVVACPLDLARFRHVMSGLRPRGLTAPGPARPDEAGNSTGTGPGEDAVAEPFVGEELAGLPESARTDAARRHVTRILADVLGHDDAGAVRQDTGFFDLGLDSIAAVDLVARLSAAFGAALAVADVFDHPTVTRLAEFVMSRPTRDAPPRATRPHGSPAPAGAVPDNPQHGEPGPRTAPPPATQDNPASSPATAAGPEPVAIVGMAGRFPGADSVDDLWDLLNEGRDGVTTVPADRRDTAVRHGQDQEGAIRIASDQGGFLRHIDRFDADFFDIPAREADNLDPQQRLLLESAWHALEDSGTDPHGLRNTRTGVFVGVSYADYARLLARGGAEHVDAYYSTGTALNAAAGRIAYFLGLNGPAVAVDTACSSSLVAIHLAVRSLRSGETDAVLAGGVNIMLDPASSVAVSRAHMLSPDGRCRTFSADANGFVRSEGCGVLVLKRLGDARRDGDRVLAVIRGSAVNQDGASSGLTAPSGTAQEAMLNAALRDAATEPGEVSYLETHGTGTALGDPIEVGAAWRAFGAGRRPGEPLRIGSVKSNIGHCESAAGMASVIKTVLALRNGVLPANLHFSRPNPHIDWASMNVQVVEARTPWRAGTRPRVAGVSGFGFTGTNAHVVLAEAPEVPEAPAVPVPAGPPPGAEASGRLRLLPLSAPDEHGLERLSELWRRRLDGAPDGELAALTATAGAGRAHFRHRRALLGRDSGQLLSALDGPASAPAPHAPRIAFLFSGQGSQYAGMGRELYESEPVFREAYDACDRILAPALGASLTGLVLYGDDPGAVDETRVTQPALVSLEVALAELWKSWGVVPSVVMGHSVGEIAAAMTAGVMDLPTGLTLIADRARLMQATERGAMLAVMAPEEDTVGWAREFRLDIAAVNGPRATVVSGAPEEIGAFAARLTERSVRHRRLSVSHAFHSRLLDPALDEFAASLAGVKFAAPAVPVISNVSGRIAAADEYDAGYWRRHARQPVRFLDGASRLAALDVDICLEIGPDRTLVNLVQAAGLAPHGGIASSLRRKAGDRDTLLASAAKLYERGQDLDWRRIHGPADARRPDAPRYPFAASRYWAPPAANGAKPPAPEPHPRPSDAPAWGRELRSPALHGRVFATERSTVYPPHLTDHRLFGVVSVPGASQMATALSALGSSGAPVVLEDLHFPRALVLRDGERYDLQTIEAEQDHGIRTVSVQSLVDRDLGQWQEHLAARLAPPEAGRGRPAPDHRSFAAAAQRHLSGDDFYAHLRTLGYHLGPSFRWIRDVWIHGDEAIVRFAEPDEMNESPEGYEIHPGLLDSCLQSTVAFAVAAAQPGSVTEEAALAVPFAADRVSFPGRPARDKGLWGHVRAVRSAGESADFLDIESADLHLFGEDGTTVLAVDRFRFRRAPRELLERSLRQRTEHAHVLRAVDTGRTVPAGAGRSRRITVAGAGQPLVTSLVRALEGLGHRVTVVTEPASVPGTAATAADLTLDARFLAAAADGPIGTAGVLSRVQALTHTLQNAPRDVPYAVLCAGPAEGGDPRGPLREALWGMLASLEAEQHDRRLVRITAAEGAGAADLARALTGMLDAGLPETRLEVGADGVRAVRLVPYSASAPPRRPDFAGSAALITGGLGALGLSTAEILADWGVGAVTLMGRSAPDEAASEVIDALGARGVRVQVVRGDVTDADDCRRAVADAGRHAPLRLVFHLAGVTRDGAFENLDDRAFADVFAAKAAGAAQLAAVLEGHELDAFVLYSSVAGVLGSPGQTNYAAANGCLDGLARALRADGVPATSVAWGPWTPRRKGGMAASQETGRAIGRRGIRPLDDDEAKELLHLAVTGRSSGLVAVAVDSVRYAAEAHGHPGAALMGTAPVAGGPATTGGRGGGQDDAGRPRGWLRKRLDGLDAPACDEQLRSVIGELAAEALGDPSPVDDELGFSDMGLDSIMVIDLRTRLSYALGADLPATVALDHPTVALLAAYAARHAPGAAPAPRSAVPDGDGSDPVPGAAPDTDIAGLSFDDLVHAVRADLSEEK